MVLMSDDFLADGSVIRSRNQNGSCFSNGASVPPCEWNPCNVSAVRDFLRGCGPIVGSDQEVNPSSSSINNNNQDNDTETIETEVKLLSHDMSKSTEDGKMGMIVEFQKGDNQTMLMDEIRDPINSMVEVDDDGGNVINESKRKMNIPQRRVFAVRDFPPYCGLNATEPPEEEQRRINGREALESRITAVEEMQD